MKRIFTTSEYKYIWFHLNIFLIFEDSENEHDNVGHEYMDQSDNNDEATGDHDAYEQPESEPEHEYCKFF